MRKDKEAGPHRYASKRDKSQFEENSSDEGNQAIRRRVAREEFKMILKFRTEDEQVNLSPIALSRELRKKM